MRAQWLAGTKETKGRDAASVVAHLVGVQAQDQVAAGLAVRARSTGLAPSDLDSLVLTWSLRGTRHLHVAEDVWWLIDLLGPAFGRRDVDSRAVAALAKALSGGPLTRPEVKQRLARVGVDPSGQGAIHVIQQAALQGILAVLPGPDGERYAPLPDVVPRPRPVDPDQAAAELVRRYQRAFALATPRDFATWSGLGLTLARRVWTEPSPRPAAARPTPTRLLGAFDTLLLGYADRSLHLSPDHARRVNAGGGMIKPIVLVDGIVAGTWTRPRKSIVVHPFPGARLDRPALERETRDIGRFLGTPLSLTVEEAAHRAG